MKPRCVLVLLLAVGWCLSCSRRDTRSADPLIDLGTHRLQVHSEGRGSPVIVLEAGLTDGIDKLQPLQYRPAKVTRVVAYDRAASPR